MATNNKDFRIKNGLIVDGANATVNGNTVLTNADSVNALSDVTISSPTSGQVLKWNGTAWINDTDATGEGGAGNSFTTVSANGTSIVADSSTDTLTITPGSGMSIVGNATSDTVTFSVDYAEKIYYLVRNNTGSTILKGTLVSATGAEPSGRIDVAPHETTGTQDSELRVMGMATANISNGVNGEVISFGTLVGIDTRGDTASAIAVGDETWAEGDILYAHPTVAGKLTKVRPQHDLAVAFITVRHASTGQIAVRIIPGNNHLEWLHDVAIDGTPADNELLAYNSATSTWINQTAEEAGVASLSGATFTGEVEVTSGNQFTGSGAGLNTVPAMVTDDTKPSSPVDGQVWFNASTGKTYVYYVDADSGQWVEIFGAKDVQDLKIRTENIEQNVFNRNYIINGGFDIWQRGTSSFSANSWTADRWSTDVGNIASRSTDTPEGQAPYSIKHTGGTGNAVVRQGIELNATGVQGDFFDGSQWTISYWAKVSSGTRDAAFYSAFTNGSASGATVYRVVAANSNIGTVTTSWQRFTLTFSVPTGGSVASATALQITPYVVGNGSSVDTYITGVQLERGSVATPFRRQGDSIQAELAACQRYYQRFTVDIIGARFGIGMMGNSSTGNIYINAMVPMRVKPSSLEYSNLSHFNLRNGDATVTVTPTAIALGGAGGQYTNNLFYIDVSASVTTNQPAYLRAASADAYLGFTAEL